MNSYFCDQEVKLETTYNTRDLGGYYTDDGKITKHGMFFRSDNTHQLTESDIKKAKEEYNLKTVIDLRTEKETEDFPDRFANVEGINYINTPISYDDCLEEFKASDQGLSILYFYILKNQKHALKDIFDTIANAENGGILFHCTLGRDRTAIVAMLLLGLAEVNKQNIIEDYEITYSLIKHLDIIKRDLNIYGEKKCRTFPEYIEKIMTYIKENYNTFENYLIDCSVSQENLEKIKNRFVG